jgi:hypothetical protein
LVESESRGVVILGFILMTTLSFSDLVGGLANQLIVPSGTESMTAVDDAALAWAEGGSTFYQFFHQQKNPGLIVGLVGQRKFHVTRSKFENGLEGLRQLVLLSTLENLVQLHLRGCASAPSIEYREWTTLETVPFQSTRANDSLRGHYIFATPQGGNYGNSKGMLRGAWGEVRGKNGIIVVSPTPHSKASQGGQYLWVRTGLVPLLPTELQKLLPEARYQSVQAVEISEAEDFLSKYNKNDSGELF